MIEQTTENPETNLSEKEIVIGKFTPKRKFLNFVTGGKSGVRFISDYAFIKSEQLTGTIENAIFKVTICDNGTINFEETDTNFTDEKMIQRFIDSIDELDVTGYMGKFVLYGIEFLDKDNKKLYLEVQHEKPIEKLFSLFDKLKTTDQPVSEDGMSILDSLFGETDDKSDKQDELTNVDLTTPDIVEDDKPTENVAQRMMRESFEAMNAEKVAELKGRIEKNEKNIKKYKYDISQAESLMKKESNDLRVLNSRLESLVPADVPNGFVFFVSAENKTGIEADQTLKDVVAKISPMLNLKADAVVNLLTQGFYTIKIAKKENFSVENITENKEEYTQIFNKINKIDILGKVTMVSPSEFEYRGELTWHQLVGKMIKFGFEQEAEFDKLCGSNSYEVEKKDELLLDTSLLPTNNTMDNAGEGWDMESDSDTFEEDNGYPMGDEFVFAISYDSSATNELGDPKASIAITPKSYWDKEACQYDQHIFSQLEKTFPLIKSVGPNTLEELVECGFSYNDLATDMCIDIDKTIEFLCKAGLKPCVGFQNHISSSDTTEVMDIVTNLGYQNLIC